MFDLFMDRMNKTARGMFLPCRSTKHPIDMNLRNASLALITGAGMLTGFQAAAQTARLQVIHNCADAAASQVDVWLNNTLLLDNFAFRSATPFIDAPAGVPFTVGIAPANSTSAAQSIFTQSFTLDNGGSYIVVASGIVSPSGYSPAPGFSLEVFAAAREAAAGAGTDVLVLHGSTDAPTVDVWESAVVNGNLVDDLSYPEFAGYLSVPTLDFTLQVRTANNTAVVAAYSAPLATLGLEGAALTVLASGFLNPAANSNGPAFGLFVALPSGGNLIPLPAAAVETATARVQVIHNSADAIADPVDVYVNGALAIDDFAFRTATPFIDLPASGLDVIVGIAPGNSTSAGDVIAEFTYTLEDGETYILIANGIVVPTGYNPPTPFDIYAFAPAQEAAADAGTDVLVFHGSTDAPTVQVAETAVLGGAVIVPPFSYGEFAGYLEVPTLDFTLQVQLPDGTPVASFAAPLESLGLEGFALTVVASGFLNPAANNNGPAFGLFVALPDGGPLVPLPQVATGIARLQVIHNSADAAAASVDVYVNGDLLLDNFAFRTATPFIDVPSGVDLVVGIAPGNSTSAGDAIAEFTYNLAAGETYIIVANGIVSPSGYTPATPFDLYVRAAARETAEGPGTDVLAFHGCTDAPTVQVAEIVVTGGAVVVPPFSYGEFAGYLELPTADFTLQVQLPDGTPVASYAAPLSTLGLEGAALTVLASGFLNPAANSNGADFGLYVALPSGGPLVALPVVTSVNELDAFVSSINVFPNPASEQLFVDMDLRRMGQADVRITDLSGRVVRSLGASSLPAGESRIVVDVRDLASGPYVLSVIGGDTVRSLPLRIVR
jgi:hypothetical protein